MNKIQQTYLNDPEKFRHIVWDYSLSPKDFFGLIKNEKKMADGSAGGWFSRDWAIGRVLQYAPYYDAIALVSPDTIRERWNHIAPKIFNPAIRKGYEFALRKHAVSAPR